MIIANSGNGLFQYSLDGKLIRSISSAFGFNKKKVTDFTMMNEHLWVSHSGGIQRINLDLSPNVTKPFIRFDKILVNDKLAEEKMNCIFRRSQF